MTTRRADPDVLEAIESHLIRGHTPAQVSRALARESRFAGRLPTLRTLQRMARDVAPTDDSGEWRLTPDETEPAILHVVAASLIDGWKIPLTIAEAAWIRFLRKAMPEVGWLTLRNFARLYVTTEARGESTAWLSLAVSIQPWRGGRNRDIYEELGLPRLPFAMTEAQAQR